jgi:hypothetical protein
MPAKKIVQELDLLRESNSEFSQPASEQGYISSLFWEEKFGLPKDQVKEIKPQAVELPTQLYSVLNELRSMLGALIAILMVLAFLLWR